MRSLNRLEKHRSRYTASTVSGEIFQTEIGGDRFLGLQSFISHNAEGRKPQDIEETRCPNARSPGLPEA